MGCCGQKRAAFANRATPVTRRNPPPHDSSTPSSRPGVKLRYREQSPIRVEGPVTGIKYEFSGANPVQVVHRQDAEVLEKTPFFHRVA